MKKIRRSVTQRFSGVLVNSPDGLVGAITMTGRGKIKNYAVTSVVNRISGDLFVNQEGMPQFGKENLYRITGRPGYVAGDPLYRRFRERRSPPSPNLKVDGYRPRYQEPVTNLNLDIRDKDLLEIMLETLENNNYFLREFRFKSTGDSTVFIPAMKNHFKGRPLKLLESVFEHGGYFYFGKVINTSSTLEVKDEKPQVWVSPVGGLPNWAKDFQRRHN